MAKHGKKYRSAASKVSIEAVVPVVDALKKVKDLAFAKFDESVDVDINLGIDPTKGEQVVRGSITLPHAIGRQPRVIVFAKDDYVDMAKKAGADFVGSDDLIQKIKDGWLDFDYAVATPDMMTPVGELARILGPRGLLPNKKLGTVTYDVAEIIHELKKGKLFFKNDKQGIVHFKVGKVSFGVEQLRDNLSAFLKALSAAKPASSRGKFLGKTIVSSTMGVGIQISPDELLVRHV